MTKDKKRILVFLAGVLVIGLILSLVRDAANDEVYYLNDALHISDCIKAGKWPGDRMVGFHGFLFKLPAALLMLVTGPSVFAATLTDLFFALLVLYLCYRIFLSILDSSFWALAASFLVFNGVFFLRALATFKRDVPVMLALLLFLYLNLGWKSGRPAIHNWLIGLSLLLLLDAKESVFFMVLPGYGLWVLYDEILKQGREKRVGFVFPSLSRLFTAIFPSLVFMGLMFFTSAVPLNPALSKVIGLNNGGWNMFISEFFSSRVAAKNYREGGKEIFQIPGFDNYKWRANYSGKVVLQADVLTRRKYPVVKLIKPAYPSNHRSGGHGHSALGVAPPAWYRQGEYVRYSLWYKTSSANVARFRFINRFIDPAEGKERGEAAVRAPLLESDGRWHYLEAWVPIPRSGTYQTQFHWSRGRDMVMYAAGCNIEKKSAAQYREMKNASRKKRVAPAAAKKKKKPRGKPAKAKTAAARAPAAPPSAPGTGKHFRMWTLWRTIIAFVNLMLSYIGKLFYSRTFSFTSMPRFIIFPALVMSLVLFREWKKNRQFERLLLPFILWIYLLFYLLRPSFGRYILPVLPVIMLFFIFFLRDGLKQRRLSRNTLTAVVCLTAAGFFFDSQFLLIKIPLSLFFLALLWLLYYREGKEGGEFPQINGLKKMKIIFVAVLGVFSFLVFSGTSYFNARQIGRFMAFGYCSQMEEIAARFEEKEVVWINFDRGKVQFFRHDGRYTHFKAGEWGWQLKAGVPKAALLEIPDHYYTYSFSWRDGEEFRRQLQQHGIGKVALLVSYHPSEKYRFPLQERLEKMQKMAFLEPLPGLKLKHKKLYLFRVIKDKRGPARKPRK
jgi:hypothetical protein